jgi:hypothetical protein
MVQHRIVLRCTVVSRQDKDLRQIIYWFLAVNSEYVSFGEALTRFRTCVRGEIRMIIDIIPCFILALRKQQLRGVLINLVLQYVCVQQRTTSSGPYQGLQMFRQRIQSL